MIVRPGAKGFDLEEALKLYFWRAGYFAVRGVPYRLEGEDVTDVDLWLYERPAALTRRRLIVDAKNRRSPKVAERLIWTKGLQAALRIDDAIVATTDTRLSARRLAKSMGITLLDGNAVSKLLQSQSLKDAQSLRTEELDVAVRSVDKDRRSNDWRDQLLAARSSLISGFGVQSTNACLAAAHFFAEQAILAHPASNQAQAALRVCFHVSALAAISLDFMLADELFRPREDRKLSVTRAIRFGEAELSSSLSTIKAALGLARSYAPNGAAVSKQIEHAFYADAGKIPAEIIAEYSSRLGSSDQLFNVAREVEEASSALQLPSYDELGSEAKAFVGVVLDFNGVSREKFAKSWPRGSSGPFNQARADPQSLEDTGDLFYDDAKDEVSASASKRRD
ncbi:hypothetical protein [Bradyrhizobium sp. SSUT77]|uniref:hypothetical protein n=1 Tax=Bradyrhizobium sp. SSUT77 TaxID=3040603 RepID=UPI002449A835|nr:hypothetical protein [Bradyrhizobium sp. SSUT77]MDH2340993.1 hypothetical protein [Bradyrhizobium sp. SSUT77]